MCLDNIENPKLRTKDEKKIVCAVETTKPYSYAAAVLKQNMAIADSGTTGHFLQINSDCIEKRKVTSGLEVKLPDGATIKSTHTAILDIPQLPMRARRAHLFPDIKHALLSISMLCDEGYMAIFDKIRVYIIKDGIVLLSGIRDPRTNLYMVNITPDNNQVQPELDIKHMQNLGGIEKFANNAYEIKVQKDLIFYYHKCCFSPVASTWRVAIENGNFNTWPGLTSKAVQKYFPDSIATAKGHMKQTRKNIRSTKNKFTEEKERIKIVEKTA